MLIFILCFSIAKDQKYINLYELIVLKEISLSFVFLYDILRHFKTLVINFLLTKMQIIICIHTVLHILIWWYKCFCYVSAFINFVVSFWIFWFFFFFSRSNFIIFLWFQINYIMINTQHKPNKMKLMFNFFITILYGLLSVEELKQKEQKCNVINIFLQCLWSYMHKILWFIFYCIVRSTSMRFFGNFSL